MVRSVLVVEDTADIAEVLQCAMQDEGYDCSTCLDSAVAVETVQRLMPDVVILDLMMVPVSGQQIARAVRDAPATSHIPIILVSAIDRLDDERQALGLRYALPKPLDIGQLLDAVATVVPAPSPPSTSAA